MRNISIEVLCIPTLQVAAFFLFAHATIIKLHEYRLRKLQHAEQARMHASSDIESGEIFGKVVQMQGK